MTFIGVKQLLCLIVVMFEGHHALDWSNFLQINSEKNSYDIAEVGSTNELNTFMAAVTDYFYFSQRGSRNYQYKQSVQKIVIVENSTLEAVPTKVFEKFANLAEFSAVAISLEEINRDDFGSAKNLQKLMLSSNQIKRLDNMIFMHCKKLVEVDLSSNEISFIHDNAFEGTSSYLKKIDLSNNKIKFLKEDSLVLLLENIPFTEEDVAVHFTNNMIGEVQPSNKTVSKKLPPLYLALMNNQLEAFECATIKYTFLDLENNRIKSLNSKTSFLQLDVGHNNMKELFIKNTTTFIKAANNQLTNLTIESGSQLDTLVLSGNNLGNDILMQLKGLKHLHTLELSATHLTALSVETFADLELLETLRLDQNSILNIGHGVLAHQAKLVSLNISYNALNSIDLHVFGALSSLEHLDISGNNISGITDYDNFRQILPRLSTIGLAGNLWSCSYLSKMKISLNMQNISIQSPQNRVKVETNFDGIECSENSELIAPVTANSDDVLAQKLNSIIEKVNDLKINAIGSKNSEELAKVKLSIALLQNDVLGLKSTSLLSQISNATNINEVRSLVEQMNNVTLEKQKLAYDQLVHKINELSLEISKFKIDTEKLFMNKKEESLRNDLIASPMPTNSSSNQNFTRLEILLILFLLITLILLIIFTVHKTKNYVNSKFDQIARQRISRRNSISTVVTYDNANNV